MLPKLCMNIAISSLITLQAVEIPNQNLLPKQVDIIKECLFIWVNVDLLIQKNNSKKHQKS